MKQIHHKVITKVYSNMSYCDNSLLLNFANAIRDKNVNSSKSELIKKGLREIFNFYCSQQQSIGGKHTFEDLLWSSKNMTMGEFVIFCKDFSIPVTLVKIKELFIKKSKYLDINGFIVILQIFRIF